MDTSSFSILDQDSLLSIFDIITCRLPNRNDPTDRPLRVVQAMSHVCQRWRGLLIGSPFIWGRIIDLDTKQYGQKRGHWLEMVATRAGSSPLWIFGDVFDSSWNLNLFNKQAFFIRLLQRWERIEKLSVIIHDTVIPDSIQNCFLSRAPILKHFDIEAQGIAIVQEPLFLETLQPGSSQSLFADYTPSLRTFSTFGIVFNPDSLWIPNLVEMASIPTRLLLRDIIALLKRTPILKKITLDTRLSDLNENEDLSPLQVPQLQSIFLVTTVPGGARVLDHLIPGKLSFFRIITFKSSGYLSNQNILPSFARSLPVFISSYFSSNSPTVVRLAVKWSSLEFSDVPKDDGMEQGFGVDIGLSHREPDQSDANKLVACILETFTTASAFGGSLSTFGSIIDMTLDLKWAKVIILENLRSMLAVFQNVQYIRIDEYSSKKFTSVCCPDHVGSDKDRVIFPKLHTVYLTSRNELEIGNTAVEAGLTDFLRRRKQMGYPVAILDLTTCMKSYYAQDLSSLEQVVGLEVVWKGSEQKFLSGSGNGIGSYICGSGNPQKLRELGIGKPNPISEWEVCKK